MLVKCFLTDKNSMVVDVEGFEEAQLTSLWYHYCLGCGVGKPDPGDPIAGDVSEAFYEDNAGSCRADVGEEAPGFLGQRRAGKNRLHAAVAEGKYLGV